MDNFEMEIMKQEFEILKRDNESLSDQIQDCKSAINSLYSFLVFFIIMLLLGVGFLVWEGVQILPTLKDYIDTSSIINSILNN